MAGFRVLVRMLTCAVRQTEVAAEFVRRQAVTSIVLAFRLAHNHAFPHSLRESCACLRMSAQCDAAYGAAQTHTCSYRPTPAAPSRTIQMPDVIPLDVWGRSIDPNPVLMGTGTSTRSQRSSSRVGRSAVAFIRTSSAPIGETSSRSTTSTGTAGVTSSVPSALWLLESVRQSDLVGRFGGEEFLAVAALHQA
jgi:hypothetical protein